MKHPFYPTSPRRDFEHKGKGILTPPSPPLNLRGGWEGLFFHRLGGKIDESGSLIGASETTRF